MILVEDIREGGGWLALFVAVWVSVLADDDERADAGITLETTDETVERSTKSYISSMKGLYGKLIWQLTLLSQLFQCRANPRLRFEIGIM